MPRSQSVEMLLLKIEKMAAQISIDHTVCLPPSLGELRLLFLQNLKIKIPAWSIKELQRPTSANYVKDIIARSRTASSTIN